MTPEQMNTSPVPHRRPYASPSVEALGRVTSHTAGPDDSGDVDQIIGQGGGFTLNDPS